MVIGLISYFTVMPHNDSYKKPNHIYSANNLENIETKVKYNYYFTFVNRQILSANRTDLAICYPILHTFLMSICYTFAIKCEFVIFY